MATVQEQLKLKRVPIDKWSTREQLCLSSSVLRSGDQNWMSVSRSVKMFGESNRPEDWFSQKNCAVQYSTMLEKAETPKRKKRSGSSDKDGPVETAGEIILRKCTAERIEELMAILEAEKAGYLKEQKEHLLIEKGEATPEQISQWTLEMENEKRQAEIDAQNHAAWLKERERKKAQLERAWKPQLTTSSRRKLGIIPESPGATGKEMDHTIDSSISSLFNADALSDDSTEPKVLSPTPPSPFLTSLLKNPPPSKISPTSSILHSAITSQRGTTPTITSLLSSSPGVPLVVGGNKKPDEMAAAGVPTLSMLLQIPPGGSDKMAAGLDSFTGSGIGSFGHPSSDQAMHHPQHQQLQLCKSADTDEILDVVDDVEQSLVEDMEPIEIGLEEIIADLEQAANRDALAAGGKDDENIALEDIPETPTNVDTFHKIFDDFYAMNVVRPRAETDGEGKGDDVSVVLDAATRGADEKQFVVSQFDVSRESLNAELDNAVAYVEEREAAKPDEVVVQPDEVVVKPEEAKANLSTTDHIFDSLLASQPLIVVSKVAEPDASFGYAETSTAEIYDGKDKAVVLEELKSEEISTVFPQPEIKSEIVVAEVPSPDMKQELEEITVEVKMPPDVTTSASVESEPVTTRQASDRIKEKPSSSKALVEDNVASKKPSRILEKSDEKVSKKSKSKDKPDSGVNDGETSRKDVLSILKTELLKHPDKIEEMDTVKAEDDVIETTSAKAEADIEEAAELVACEEESKLKVQEIVPSEKVTAVELVEDTDESMKDVEDKTTHTLRESVKASEFIDSANNSNDVMNQDKPSSTEFGTPKSELSVIDLPSSSRNRLIRRTGTPAIDSLPGSPASSITEEEKEYRAWKKAIMLVWNGLAAHKYASIFCKPITDDIAPHYSAKIKRPVDLNGIKRLIENGVIRTTSEFQCNIMLMFLNACMYNVTEGDYFKSALEMQKDSLQQIQEFIATQRLIQSPGDSASTRRETRTTADTSSISKRKRDSDVGKIAKKRKL